MSTMQRQATAEKVLRACVVQGGKVIEEQRLPRRAPLTIGTGARNTFVIAEPTLPKAHRLFEVHGSTYELILTEGMRGKVSSDRDPAPVDFVTLKSQGVLKKRGDYYVLPLTEAHRGKVIIGDITLIFQFVVPPPKPAAPVLPEGTRVGIWKRIDWPFAACMAAFMVIETPIVISLHFQPIPEEPSLETLDDRWARLIVPERKPEVKKPEEEGEGTKAKVNADTSKAKKASAGKDAPADEGERARQKAARTAEIRKSIAGKGLAGLLVADGPGATNGAVADVFREGGIGGDIDSAFDGISGIGLATAAGQHSTRGGGSGEAATINGLATAGGGPVGLSGKTESRVGSVRTEAPEVDGALDSDAIAKVVRSRMRMVQDCYERELKRDPSLSGKIEIEFTIGEDGAVTEARVSNNKMNSKEVGDCIVGRIQRWKFPKPDGGSVTVNFPFIFTPSG